MIESETLLVKCPHCGAWPMAAGDIKASAYRRELRFKCARCGHKEEGQLRPRANGGPSGQHRAEAPVAQAGAGR